MMAFLKRSLSIRFAGIHINIFCKTATRHRYLDNYFIRGYHERRTGFQKLRDIF